MDKAHLGADLLCDYAEGLLDPAARLAADGHLQACPECRRELEATRAYFTGMAGLEPYKAPDRFLTKVHGRIARGSPWKRLLAALSSPRLIPVPLMGLAVVLVGVYLAFLAPQMREKAPEAPRTAALAKQKRAPEPAAQPMAEQPLAAAPAAKVPAARKSPTLAASKPSARPPAPASEPLAFADRQAGNAADSKAARSGAKSDDGIHETESLALSDQEIAKDAGREPATAYILDNAGSPGADPVLDHLAQAEGVGRLAQPQAKKEAKQRSEAEAAPATGDQPLKGSASRDEDMAELSKLGEDRGSAIAAESRNARANEKAAPPPATTPKPWAPQGYALKPKSGRIDAAGFRGGLEKLGVRVLRHEGGPIERFELEVPATRVIDLEAFLRGHGQLVPSARALPGKKDGAPIFMTLSIDRGR